MYIYIFFFYRSIQQYVGKRYWNAQSANKIYEKRKYVDKCIYNHSLFIKI